MLAASALVAERARIRSGVLAAGVPAREKKELSGSALAWTQDAADEYQKLRLLHMTTSRVRLPEDERAA